MAHTKEYGKYKEEYGVRVLCGDVVIWSKSTNNWNLSMKGCPVCGKDFETFGSMPDNNFVIEALMGV